MLLEWHKPTVIEISDWAEAEPVPLPSSLEDRRKFYANQIAAWCACQRVEEGDSDQPQLTKAAADASLNVGEIARLKKNDRLRAQRASLVDNFAHLFATNKGADLSTGILLLVTYLSDNDQGCCRLTMARMAKFFGRTERAVRDAVVRLEDAGVIRIERTTGRNSSRSWPVINRMFADEGFSIIWLVDARAPGKSVATNPEADFLVGGTSNPEADFLVHGANPEVGCAPTRKPTSSDLTNRTSRRREAEFSFTDGELQLTGSLYAEWREHLGGDEALQSALRIVAAYLPPNPSLARVVGSLEIHRTRRPQPLAAAAKHRSQPRKGSVNANGVHTLIYRSQNPERFNALVSEARANGRHEAAAHWEKCGAAVQENAH